MNQASQAAPATAPGTARALPPAGSDALAAQTLSQQRAGTVTSHRTSQLSELPCVGTLGQPRSGQTPEAAFHQGTL